MSQRLARPLIALVIACACAAPQTAAPSAAPSSATSSPIVAATLPAGAIRFVIAAGRSQATIRVREQVAGISAPGDAVLTTGAFSGSLVLLAGGTFATGSVVAVDLDTLKSNEPLRDEWIKFNTLNTRSYPRAEFTLERVSGIPMPIAAQGEWAATLEGIMKIHGAERRLSWPVQVTRAASEVRVRGETSFRFGDYGMAVPSNRLILSVVDDVRLEIDMVAQEP